MGKYNPADKESFLFYRDWWESLSAVEPEKRLAVIDAVMRFVFDGVEPPNDPFIRLVIKTITRDIEKWEEKREKAINAVNTRWGKSKKTNKIAKEENTDVYDGIQTNADVYDGIHNVNVNVNASLSSTKVEAKESNARTREESLCRASQPEKEEKFFQKFLAEYNPPPDVTPEVISIAFQQCCKNKRHTSYKSFYDHLTRTIEIKREIKKRHGTASQLGQASDTPRPPDYSEVL